METALKDRDRDLAELFIRTLKENLLWGRYFETIKELRLALLDFAAW